MAARAHEAERLGVPFLGEVPLDMDIREKSDSGLPVVATEPDGPHAQIYRDIAARVRDELAGREPRRRRKSSSRPERQIRFNLARRGRFAATLVLPSAFRARTTILCSARCPPGGRSRAPNGLPPETVNRRMLAMKRRQFLTDGRRRAGRSRDRQAGHRPVDAGAQMAL